MRALAKRRVIKSATRAAMKNFGARVRQEREHEGLTLEQMSERVGMSAASLQRIEMHCSNIPLSLIIDIARELGIDVRDLFLPAKGKRAALVGPTLPLLLPPKRT